MIAHIAKQLESIRAKVGGVIPRILVLFWFLLSIALVLLAHALPGEPAVGLLFFLGCTTVPIMEGYTIDRYPRSRMPALIVMGLMVVYFVVVYSVVALILELWCQAGIVIGKGVCLESHYQADWAIFLFAVTLSLPVTLAVLSGVATAYQFLLYYVKRQLAHRLESIRAKVVAHNFKRVAFFWLLLWIALSVLSHALPAVLIFPIPFFLGVINVWIVESFSIDRYARLLKSMLMATGMTVIVYSVVALVLELSCQAGITIGKDVCSASHYRVDLGLISIAIALFVCAANFGKRYYEKRQLAKHLESTMYAVLLYVYRGKAYLPVMARFELVSWVFMEPVFTAELEVGKLVTAVEKVIAMGPQALPDVTPEEWRKRKNPVLAAMGAASWEAMYHNWVEYFIVWVGDEILVHLFCHDKKGQWQPAPEKSWEFPKDTPLEEIVELILEDIQTRPEVL